MRETTYWAKLCLVQVAGADEAHCIEGVARALQLPITGDPYSFCYPFILR